jgi:hypothetical protein
MHNGVLSLASFKDLEENIVAIRCEGERFRLFPKQWVTRSNFPLQLTGEFIRWAWRDPRTEQFEIGLHTISVCPQRQRLKRGVTVQVEIPLVSGWCPPSASKQSFKTSPARSGDLARSTARLGGYVALVPLVLKLWNL